MKRTRSAQQPAASVRKGAAATQSVMREPTGIVGFDKISGGGLPKGRITAVIGGPGTGKSMFGMQTLVNRFRTAGETGAFVTFEEDPDRVRSNLAGLDWDFGSLSPDQIAIIDARLPGDTIQGGAFDLSGLLAGLSARKAATGLRNVVFDGLDMLIGALNDENLERRELSRIDEWIRAEGVSALLTVKAYGQSEREQRRSDLIQYVTDCVVLIENSLFGANLSRTLRILKYRGSGFAANAVPMVIDSGGIGVIPAEASRGRYPVFAERLSTGVGPLDAILGGGFIRGSSILVSGAPGTAKTSLAASLVEQTCKSGRKAAFVSFDESDFQIIANMRSIGIDLGRHVKSGKLVMSSLRSGGHSPEEGFLTVARLVREQKPDVLVVDPMSAFSETEYPFANEISENLIDLAKSSGVTFLGTSLLSDTAGDVEASASHVSTIADTWIHLAYVAQNGERNRALTIVKSRGTRHANQVRELVLSAKGVDLIDVFVGEGKVLFGSARVQMQQEESRQAELAKIERGRKKFALERGLAELTARAKVAEAELAAKNREMKLYFAEEQALVNNRLRSREQMEMGSQTEVGEQSRPRARKGRSK